MDIQRQKKIVPRLILVTLVILLALFSSKEFVFALSEETKVTLRVKIITTTQTVPGIFDWEEEENEESPTSYPLTYKANLDSLEGKSLIWAKAPKGTYYLALEPLWEQKATTPDK